jgi:hypothetical protein
MPDIGAYFVRLANSPDAPELRLEASNAIEAGMRAFAHFADGWPETVAIVRRGGRDGLTITISVGNDELTLTVLRDESGSPTD